MEEETSGLGIPINGEVTGEAIHTSRDNDNPVKQQVGTKGDKINGDVAKNNRSREAKF